MKTNAESQSISTNAPGALSFFVYTTNSNGQLKRFESLEQFDAQMRDGNGGGLLLYDNPARLIANELAEGAFDGAALRQWSDEAQRHVEVIRQHRPKMLVIERSTAEDPAVNAAFTSAFPSHPQPVEFAQPDDAQPSLALLIALFAVRQLSPSARLLGELEASSVNAEGSAPSLDNSIKLIAKELEGISRTQLILQELEDKNRALLRANEDLKQETEKKDAVKHEFFSRQAAELQTDLQATVARQAELDSTNLSLQRKNAALESEIFVQKNTLDAIYRSTSWRISAPIRSIKKVFSR